MPSTRGRSQSRGPHPPRGPGGYWNQPFDNRPVDRPSYNHPNDLFRDRRGDGRYHRPTGYDSYRPSIDDTHHPQQENEVAVAANRRRASMHEPPAQARPMLGRTTSFEDRPKDVRRESPVQNSAIVTAPIQPPAQIIELRNRSIPGDIEERPTDPRLRLQRSITAPLQKAGPITSREHTESPATPIMGMDGAGDVVAEDIVMADPDVIADNTDAGLFEALIRFLNHAVAAGIILHRYQLLEDEVKKSKVEKDKAAQQTKLAPIIQEGHKNRYNQAVKSFNIAYKELRDSKQGRAAKGHELVDQIATLISNSFTEEYHKLRSSEQQQNEAWQNGLLSKVEALDKDIVSLQTTGKDSDRLAAIEKKQQDTQTLIEKARPQFESGVKILRENQKRQNDDVEFLKKENASLKEQMKSMQHQMQDFEESVMGRFKQRVLQTEFESYKAAAAEAQLEQVQPSEQQDAEIKAIRANITSLGKTIENELSHHVLKTDFDHLKSEVQAAQPAASQSHDEGEIHQRETVQQQVQRLQEDVAQIQTKSAGQFAASQNAHEALRMSQNFQSQIDQHQRELNVLNIRTTDDASAPTKQKKNSASVEAVGNSPKTEARLSKLEKHVIDASAELQELRKTISEPVPATVTDALSNVTSRATENRISTLNGQLGAVQTELHRLSVLQTQAAPPANAGVGIKEIQDVSRRVATIEQWKQTSDEFRKSMNSKFTESSQRITRLEELRTNDQGSYRSLNLKVDANQKAAASKLQHYELAGKIEEISNRSNADTSTTGTPMTGGLSTKDRMLLNSMESSTKRLNVLENSMLDLANKDQTAQKPQEKMPTPLVLEAIREPVDESRASFNSIKDSLQQRGAGWDAGLKSLNKFCQDGITALSQKIDKSNTDLKATDHSLRSLTTRYNNITSDKMARQIAEVIQPLPAQLRAEQAEIKVHIAAFATRLSSLATSVGSLVTTANQPQPSPEVLEKILEKARELFVETDDLNVVQETISGVNERLSKLENVDMLYQFKGDMVDVTTRISKLEDAPVPAANGNSVFSEDQIDTKFSELSTRFQQGRDELQAYQKDHELRLKKLESRTANVNDEPSDDEDEPHATKSSEDLLRQFASHRTPTELRSMKPSPRSSVQAVAAPESPVPRKGSGSGDNVGRAFGTRPPSRESSQQKSLASRTEPPVRPAPISRSLESRIEPRPSSNHGSSRDKRRYTAVDSDDEEVLNTIVVQSTPPQDSPRRRGRKFARNL